MSIPAPTEHVEQCHVVAWFWAQYPKLRKRLFAIPNGAHLAGTPRQRAAKMARMKAEGFRVGVSDLFLMEPRGGFAGLFVEMKRRNAVPSDISDDQEAFIADARAAGYRAEAAKGAAAAIAIITEYLNQEAA